MITLENNRLVFRFADVHEDAGCKIDLQRTLRIPDDNQSYPLPPGFGSFPLFHVDDYLNAATGKNASVLPSTWAQHGGVFMPMYQSEALWIHFSGFYPCAIKIAAGKINAVTGEPWSNPLSDMPQDYVVVPGQRWLDGFGVAKGLIRQFVAMPLGQGFSVEGQLSGAEVHGGLQILVCPMKAKVYKRLHSDRGSLELCSPRVSSLEPINCRVSSQMGLAPGGLMRQQLFYDDYRIDAWDQKHVSRCFVHLLNSEQFFAITGEAPPSTPVSSSVYNNAGLPWFGYYEADKKALAGSSKLAALDSVAATMFKNSKKLLPDNKPLDPKRIIKLSGKSVREGTF